MTYTTQAQTGEDSQATQVYETIQGAESTEQELGLLGDGLAETVQAELGETSVNEYRAREIGEVSISTEGAATVTLSNLSGVTAATEGFVMYLGSDGLWHYLPVTFGDRSATFTLPYSTTIILYVRVAVAQSGPYRLPAVTPRRNKQPSRRAAPATNRRTFERLLSGHAKTWRRAALSFLLPFWVKLRIIGRFWECKGKVYVKISA